MAYDVFLSYNSLDRPIVLRVAEELKRRGITCFIDRSCLLPGRNWVVGLEKALADSQSMAVFLGPHEMGRWQQKERTWALDRHTNNPSFFVIPVLLPECKPPLDFLRLLTWIDLRQHTTDPLQLDTLAAAIRGNSVTEDGLKKSRVTVCPYRGLRYFREEDAAFFFGRDKYIAKLVKKVEQRPFVAVVGASGSGKSSVVRAGLIPRLRARDQSPVWEIVTMLPEKSPLHALAEALLPLIEPTLSCSDLMCKSDEIATNLSMEKIHLWDLVAKALQQQGTDRLLLVVDPWEDLFTECEDTKARRCFIDELLDATQRKQSPLSVVLTVRSDFYDLLLHDRALLDWLEDGKLDLGPMTIEELQEAIEKPVDQVGLSFQDGLVDRLLTDARHEPGRLSLLEFALEELWRRRDKGGQLTHAAYENLGRLSGAIATRAEVAFSALDDAEKAAAPGLFRRLVRAGSKTEEDTRRRADLNSLDEISQRVARRLADERLLVTTREGVTEAKGSPVDKAAEPCAEPLGEVDSAEARETVEVAHEELLRRWDRSIQWINTDRSFLQWQSRLAPSLEQYRRDRKSALLRHGALREARRYYRSRRNELEDNERAFLEASFVAEKRIKILLGSFAIFVVFTSWVLIGEICVRVLLGSSHETFENNYQQLWLFKPFAVIRLQSEVANEELELPQRLHAGFALARFGSLPDDQLKFLLSEIPNAGAEERRNYFYALAAVPSEQLEEPLLQLAKSSDSLKAKRRYATTGLQLGMAAPAMAALEEHPSARTELIHNWEDWPPDAERLSAILRESLDEDRLCSTICCALGLSDTLSLTTNEQNNVVAVMRDLHKNVDGGATRSASGWALRQWKKDPFPGSEKVPIGRKWFVNHHGMSFVLIPKGKFRMGLGAQDLDTFPVELAHDVTISEDFYLGDREVTGEQYQAVVGHAASGQGQHPVTQVTWFDAVEFCIELSKKEGLSPYYELTNVERGVTQSIENADVELLNGAGYRLPTEAEWEYAFRAGNRRRLYYAEDNTLRPWQFFDEVGFNTNEILACGSKLPNAWGLFDMHCNIFEWCQDKGEEVYCRGFPPVDPVGPRQATTRVVRGGTWTNNAMDWRVAFRCRRPPEYRVDNLGFRVAAVPSGKSGK